MENAIKKCASCFVFYDNKILLIYHKKFNLYLQPGGHIEGNELPYETAIREVKEETGIDIIIKNKEPFNIETYKTKIGPQLDYQFIGEPINYNPVNNDESYLCGWFDIDNLDNVMVAPDIKEKIKKIRRD